LVPRHDLPQPTTQVPVDLFAFGNAQAPRPPRAGQDVDVDENGMIEAGSPPEPAGASTFADPAVAQLTGHMWRLPAGTSLPAGLLVMADGRDVLPAGEQAPTHHTIYAAHRMPFDLFVALFASLPWSPAGRK